MKKLLCVCLLFTSLVGCQSKDGSDTNQPKYDVVDSADVVIVGGGGTGMSAALTALENGAEKVIIVEKLPVLGGFMRMKTGQFSAPNTTLQIEQGLTEDSAEKYEKEILKFAYLHNGHPIEYLIHSYAQNATEAWEWAYEMGVKDYQFMTDAEGNKAITNPGHMPYEYNRTYVPLGNKGSDITNPVIEVFQKNILADERIVYYTSVEGKKLLTNENGQVVGAEGLGSDGKTYKFESNKGVIMSTGGYAANPNLFELYSADLDNLISAALSSDDGYGLRMMQELGAALTDEAMEWIETYPKGMINEGSTTAGVNGSTGTYYTGGILINLEGNRFVDECHWDDEVRNQGLKEQPENIMFEIYTDKIFEDTQGTFRGAYDLFKEGGTYHDRVIVANSLEELAGKIGVDATNLVNTVNTYNDAVDGKIEDEFKRSFVAKPGENRVEVANKIEGDKFYALRLQPIVLSSRGGIAVNEHNQVINYDKEVIPGLYAGGEVVGQMWGRTIAPGVGMNGCITWGRIVGRNIMNMEMPESYTVKPAHNLFDESLFKFEKEVSDGVTFDKLTDGTYTGTSTGMNGELTVEVIVENQKITSIEVTDHKESAGISDPALENIPSKIVDAQSTNVDSVSNATITSDAIKKAVENALK